MSLAPHSYHGAAGLVPFTAFFFVVYGVFVLIARTTYHVHRDFVHQFGAAFAAVVYVGVAALLCPRWGGYGLAIAASVGMALGCVGFRLIVPTASHYAILDWPRLLAGGVIAIGCIALGLAPHVSSVERVLLGLIDFFVIYPAALVLTEAVPREDLHVMREMAAGTLTEFVAPLFRRTRAADAVETLSPLDTEEVRTLRALIAERIKPTDLAARERTPRSVLEGRAARALRTIADVESPERDDAAIGAWLFETRSSAERDLIMYTLMDHGVSVATLHAVETAASTLQRIPIGMWPPQGLSEPPAAVELPVPLEPSMGLLS